VQVIGRAPVRVVVRLHANEEVVLHVAGVGENSFAVGVCVPGLLVDLQRSFGRNHAHKLGHFAGQVIDLIGVLSLVELAAQQRHILVGFVLDDFNTLATSGLVLAGLCNTVQLSHLVLLHRHGQGNAELFDDHFGRNKSF